MLVTKQINSQLFFDKYFRETVSKFYSDLLQNIMQWLLGCWC